MKRFLRCVCIAGLVMVVPIAAHANPVLHMVMAELSGCQDYDEVGKVVKEISVEAGFKGTAWMPLHHNGGAGHVGLVILAPSLIDYGKQMDGFIALMNGKDSDVYRKLTSCVRVVRRSADEILAASSINLCCIVVDRWCNSVSWFLNTRTIVPLKNCQS